MATLFCPICGSMISEGDERCPACGYVNNEHVNTVIDEGPSGRYERPEDVEGGFPDVYKTPVVKGESKKHKGKRRRPRIGLLVAVVCLCVGLLGGKVVLKKFAERAFPQIAYEKGMAALKGDNSKAALAYYYVAAEQGDATAMNWLGWCYYNGKGTSENLKEALYWYMKSAEAGNANAMNNVGVCYEHGYGIGTDGKKAFYWYTKSAEAGYAKGMHNLSLCYKKGKGTEVNMSLAEEWEQKARDAEYTK